MSNRSETTADSLRVANNSLSLRRSPRHCDNSDKVKIRSAKKPNNKSVQASLPKASTRNVLTGYPTIYHPYLQHNNHLPKPALRDVIKTEQSVITELERRSGWKAYPRGPSSCYALSESSPGSIEQGLNTGRVVTLTLSDLTVCALLEALDTFLQNRRGNRRNARRPAVPQTPPAWEMPADIAVLDQLESMELYNCTGILPDTMNCLTQLESLKLRSCHNLHLQSLSHGMEQLTDLEITDCERLTPSRFANLPHLERVKLYRIANSDANTQNIGRDWIRDLKEHDHFAWNDSLKDLCFCSAGITNDDFAILMVDVLPHKLPNVRSIFVINNSEITSFRPLLRRWEEQYICHEGVVGGNAVTSVTFVPPSLRMLSMTGTQIPKVLEEMRPIIKFLELYHEIGISMMVPLPSTLKSDVVRCVHQINHQLTINRAGGPILLSSRDSQGKKAFSSSSNEGSLHQGKRRAGKSEERCRRSLPLSMWPIVLRRAMFLEYLPCYEATDVEPTIRSTVRRADEIIQHGEAVMRRVDQVVARARAILGDNNNNNNAAQNLGPIALNNNADVEGVEDGVVMEHDWMESSAAFCGRSRFDAVYHLLRNGPVLLATGNPNPRCRRIRSFVPRKCKRVRLF